MSVFVNILFYLCCYNFIDYNGQYLYLNHNLYKPTRPAKIIYTVGSKETLFAWVSLLLLLLLLLFLSRLSLYVI